MKLKILVLGGSGFVGQHLTKALQKTEHEIFSASRIDGLDLRDYTNTAAYFGNIKPDVIFNCAAHVGSVHYVTTYAADVITDNLQMSLNIYKAAAEVCPQAKIVNLLSNCSYPGAADIQIESEWWNGPVHESVFSYGNSKKALYMIAKCYAKQHNIKSVNFLVPNTFGPGDSTDPNKTHALNGMLIRMIEAQKKGDTQFEIWGTGSPVREWAYIDDVVSILVKSMDITEDLLEPVNLAQNKGYTIKESAQFIAEALGFEGELVFNTKYADGAPVKILDDKKFRSMFPDFVFANHKEGIKKTALYYQSKLQG
ncbi:MAG: NAD-dependent epimerase/dehydratase family protein [Candidatus Magasanikbacteria bacterium]|nr:NAD-dependent epimerase/dehydratase family protein [Candidatus Magasanikbacteria bacterium]